MSEVKNYFDFDSFMQEKDREPVVLKIFGEEEKLPPALPAEVILKTIRLQKKYNNKMAQVPHGEMFDMAIAIFSEDKVEKWSKQGLDIEQLGELIKWAMNVYMGVDTDKPVKKNQR